jgi:DNA-directed RNA polymerase sigma subunit (sigma70/sigma32)
VLARLAPIDALAAAMRAALETDGAHGLAYRACVREAAALLGTLRMSMRALERMSEPLRTHARRQRTLHGRLARTLADAGVPHGAAAACVQRRRSCRLARGVHRRASRMRAGADAPRPSWSTRATRSRGPPASPLPPDTIALLDARLDTIERAMQPARMGLFDANLRLVVSIAKRYPDAGCRSRT